MISMDAYWNEVADFCHSQCFREVIGPQNMQSLLRGVDVYCYDDFRLPQKGSSVAWILHRGLASEWPDAICKQIKSQCFTILFVNDVFTVIRPSKWPFASCLERPGRASAAEHWQLLKALRKRTPSTFKSRPTANTANGVDKFQVDRIVSALVSTNSWDGESTPNTSQSGEYLRDLQLIKTNIKALAWRLEQLDAPAYRLPSLSLKEALFKDELSFKLESRICTSADIYSDWHRSIAQCLRADNYKLRKIWEWTFALKALQAAGKLHAVSRGLGFGCGTEPLASCFANFVDKVMVTDAPIDVIDGKGWSDTSQHTSSLEDAKHDWLASRGDLDRCLQFSYADMNNIPESFRNQYDFVWSSCALEHLGSKLKGLQFVVNSALCLKPGGVAVHTTEFDLSGTSVIDNWETVLFNTEDLQVLLPELLANAEIANQGLKLKVLPFNLGRGNAFIDGFVDIPPYSYHANINSSFAGQADRDGSLLYPYPQVNLSVDGYPATSVAIIVERIA